MLNSFGYNSNGSVNMTNPSSPFYGGGDMSSVGVAVNSKIYHAPIIDDGLPIGVFALGFIAVFFIIGVISHFVRN